MPRYASSGTPGFAPWYEYGRAGAGAEGFDDETAYAFNHPGMVSGVGRQAGTDNNEFILWNYLVASADLRPPHRYHLYLAGQQWVPLFRRRTDLRVRIIGHASQSGNTVNNVGLARRRAETVSKFLVQTGVPADRIDVIGMGTSQPLADEISSENRARNRRVEIFLYVPTRQVAGLPGVTFRILPPGIVATFSAAKVDGPDFFYPRENLFAERLGGITASASVLLGGPPGSNPTMGFIQFLWQDTRMGIYRSPSSGRTVTLDYGRCMGAHLSCRDTNDAALPFSYSGPRFHTGPTVAGPARLEFFDHPGVFFPIRHKHPALGEVVLRNTVWAMGFILILGVRLGPAFLPVRYLMWRLESNRDLSTGTPTGTPIAGPVESGTGVPRGFNMDAAMSSRTCRLLARTIDHPTDARPCRPAESAG